MAIMKVIERDFAVHVDYCPRPARIWNGKPYANLFDDCSGCEHFTNEYNQDEKYMICNHPKAKNQVSEGEYNRLNNIVQKTVFDY